MNNMNNSATKLSTKDLLAIKDQLEAEQLTINKLQEYEAKLDDPGLKTMCKDMINSHKNHYNTLVKHLEC